MPKSQRVALEIQKRISGWTFSSQGFAQSLITIDKLEGKNILNAKKEVGFSATLEGTISNPDLLVHVLVYQPGSRAYRIFPALTDTQAEYDGKYRWRALCHFGELSGRGIGDLSNIVAVGLDRTALIQGRLPKKLPSTAPVSAPIGLKRVK
jgi:hypothetical protein